MTVGILGTRHFEPPSGKYLWLGPKGRHGGRRFSHWASVSAMARLPGLDERLGHYYNLWYNTGD